MTDVIKTPHVSIKRLKEIFGYNPASGVLHWAVSPCERIPIGSIAGTKHSAGYLRVMVDGKNLYVHRIAWAITHGTWPDQIDHLNGVRDANHLGNLRAVTNLINCHNKHSARKTNTGVPNVYFDGRYGTYKASLSANGTFHHLGTFKTLNEAALAVKAGRQTYQSPYQPPRIAP